MPVKLSSQNGQLLINNQPLSSSGGGGATADGRVFSNDEYTTLQSLAYDLMNNNNHTVLRSLITLFRDHVLSRCLVDWSLKYSFQANQSNIYFNNDVYLTSQYPFIANKFIGTSKLFIKTGTGWVEYFVTVKTGSQSYYYIVDITTLQESGNHGVSVSIVNNNKNNTQIKIITDVQNSVNNTYMNFEFISTNIPFDIYVYVENLDSNTLLIQ